MQNKVFMFKIKKEIFVIAFIRLCEALASSICSGLLMLLTGSYYIEFMRWKQDHLRNNVVLWLKKKEKKKRERDYGSKAMAKK